MVVKNGKRSRNNPLKYGSSYGATVRGTPGEYDRRGIRPSGPALQLECKIGQTGNGNAAALVSASNGSEEVYSWGFKIWLLIPIFVVLAATLVWIVNGPKLSQTREHRLEMGIGAVLPFVQFWIGRLLWQRKPVFTWSCPGWLFIIVLLVCMSFAPMATIVLNAAWEPMPAIGRNTPAKLHVHSIPRSKYDRHNQGVARVLVYRSKDDPTQVIHIRMADYGKSHAGGYPSDFDAPTVCFLEHRGLFGWIWITDLHACDVEGKAIGKPGTATFRKWPSRD